LSDVKLFDIDYFPCLLTTAENRQALTDYFDMYL